MTKYDYFLKASKAKSLKSFQNLYQDAHCSDLSGEELQEVIHMLEVCIINRMKAAPYRES